MERKKKSMKKKKYQATTMRLDWDLWRKFKAICAIEGVSCSERLQVLMTHAVSEYNNIVSKELSADIEEDAEA